MEPISDELKKNWEEELKEYRERLFQIKSEQKVINFYETDKPYGCFSNFAKYPIEIQGEIWQTSEHYFQAKKFEETEHEEQIRLAPTPMAAARMGRERSRPLRSDWEEVKLDIMYEAVLAKIQQHETVRDILLSTGSCVLVEHTKNDAYWGDNGDGTGQNMLGRILMQIRGDLEGYAPIFLVPQWIAYPEEHPYSMFWRMGAGEDYVMNLSKWKDELSVGAKREYDCYFKRPDDWKLKED
ncbi:NADAR family protein [Paenibacillus qinlingensis]|uniref:NADAR family protein n=1 Tax=Paenibacillus qinlingensis TaxID=1837343 RepID=UPI001FE71218|nr:NADAR family protein [Paenibacillus qinlingensis]